MDEFRWLGYLYLDVASAAGGRWGLKRRAGLPFSNGPSSCIDRWRAMGIETVAGPRWPCAAGCIAASGRWGLKLSFGVKPEFGRAELHRLLASGGD